MAGKEKNTAKKKLFNFMGVREELKCVPWKYLILLTIIVMVGLMVLLSASYSSGLARRGNSYYWFNNQLKYVLLGYAAIVAATFFDYRWLKFWVMPAVLFSLAALALVLVDTPITPEISHVRRWISVGTVTIQVSEIAKFVLVLYIAWVMDKLKAYSHTLTCGIIAPLTVWAAMEVLIFFEPHFSCMAIMALVAGTMLLFGGVNIRWLLALVALVLVGVGGYLFMIGYDATIELVSGFSSYFLGRIQGWIDPEARPYQTTQSLYSIGSGGFWGRGWGNGRQKHSWLPEPSNDFVFSTACEELGFVGGVVIIILFCVIIVYTIHIGMQAPDRFGALFCIGIAAQIGWQAMLNMAVTMAIIPNTGISLPFFSYGGTSIAMLLGEVGLVMSVARITARNNRLEKKEEKTTAKKEPIIHRSVDFRGGIQ